MEGNQNPWKTPTPPAPRIQSFVKWSQWIATLVSSHVPGVWQLGW